jgi:hypothetical protein
LTFEELKAIKVTGVQNNTRHVLTNTLGRGGGAAPKTPLVNSELKMHQICDADATKKQSLIIGD